MQKLIDELGTWVFQLTIYLVILAFLLTTILTVANSAYELTFTANLLAVATILTIGQSCFSYAETVSEKVRALAQFVGMKLLKVAIWLGGSMLLIFAYALFMLYLYSESLHMDAVRFLLLALALLNYFFALTNLHSALQGIQGLLFKTEDSET